MDDPVTKGNYRADAAAKEAADHTSALSCEEPVHKRQCEKVDQAVRPKYLEGREVTGNMRAILVDWLVQVQAKFPLLQETMYMTIDRFLQVC
ncbi:hypothetical protein SKAU_G00325250 [Synaphobranchus kaupii]|uniref:Cyclin N-terminal domain-containing protein n=1 Tax=Synaphobranchus kaupii TaxID=118154 RepID=A0A9Q1EPI4_SYNKA|nr:hypothetical protein SKAU_G00325250 [Synaphobranchus kaupii]